MQTHFKVSTKRTFKLTTSLLLVILLALPPLVNLVINDASAAALTNYNVKINNSQASATGVSYTFNWTTSATTNIKQIDIQVCTTASGTCVAPSGFSSGTPTLASDNIAGTGRTTSAPTANAFRVVVTTPAAQAVQSMNLTFTGVTNPSTINTTYYVRSTTYSDTGSTVIDGPTTAAFAVLDTTSVAVSATVDPNFTFSVAGVSVAGNFNGGSGNINVSSTATTIPFGTIATGSARIAAQDLTVTTNASNGYAITASHAANVQGTGAPLISGTTNNIDPFTGSNASPATWSTPNGTTANVNTGFFGYSTEDATLCSGTANRFTNGGAKWAGSTTVGQELVCSASGVTSETTRVGWEIEANNIQPSGSYTGTVIYVATPTY